MTLNPPKPETTPYADTTVGHTLAGLNQRWMSLVRRVTTNSVATRFFPFGTYTIEVAAQYLFALLMAMPIIALALGVAALSVGPTAFVETLLASTETLIAWGALISTNPEYAALAVAGVYILSVVEYDPIERDRKGYADEKGQDPTEFESWEQMLVGIAVAVLPLTLFALLHFEQGAAVVAATGLSPFVLALIAHAVMGAVTITWLAIRYRRYGWGEKGVNPSFSAGVSELVLLSGLTILYLGQIPLGVDLALLGSPDAPLTAAFYAHVVGMAWVARRLRWTVYEDAAGFVNINPSIPLWGFVARAPLAVAVYLAVFGSGVHGFAVVGSVGPLVAALGYIGWRATQGYGFGLMEDPYGGPGAGTDFFETTVTEENAERLSERRSRREAIEQFNKFARQNNFETLPRPKNDNFSEHEVKRVFSRIEDAGPSGSSVEEALDAYDEQGVDAGQFPPEVLSEYKQRRDAVLESL